MIKMRLCWNLALVGLLLTTILGHSLCQVEREYEEITELPQMHLQQGVEEARAGKKLFDINAELVRDGYVCEDCVFHFRIGQEELKDTELFSVDENGWLVARYELDYEAGGAGTSHVRIYNLHLYAELSDGDQIECRHELNNTDGIMLSFELLDVNDNPPMFHTANLTLRYSLRDPIKQLQLPAATDADSPANGVRNHTLEWQDMGAERFFQLENSTQVPPTLVFRAELLTRSELNANADANTSIVFEGWLVAYDADYKHSARLPLRIHVADLPPKTTAAPPAPRATSTSTPTDAATSRNHLKNNHAARNER